MIEVRPLTELPDLARAVELQREIWGFADIDLLPVRLFVVATKIGGRILGAFDSGRMIGFCLAIPGLKPGGKFYLHSHMLGVLPEYQNAGIGRRLKLVQRDEALARGVPLIEWTFDPLELKNAFFNIERLGCVIRRYVHNQYGITSSQFDQGMPTDRCTAEWWLDHPRVHAFLAGAPPPRPPIEHTIEIPYAITELRKSDVRKAREIQARAGDQFERAFSQGLAVVGFERTESAGRYLIGRWSPEDAL